MQKEEKQLQLQIYDYGKFCSLQKQIQAVNVMFSPQLLTYSIQKYELL